MGVFRSVPGILGGARYIVGQQWGGAQGSGSSSTAYTYHQTFTVEAEATRFRFKLMNMNTSPMVILAGAMAVSDKLGTVAQQYTPTESWTPITWDGSSSVTVAAGAAGRPNIKWSDWIIRSTIIPVDGTTLPIVMTRFYVQAGAFSIGNYNFTPWSATSGVNDGRFLYMFRASGDYASGNWASFPYSPYTNPFLLGFEYETKKPAFTFAAQGDSITEGAVNSSTGNFGNGWFWQAIKALRAANPNIIIGYVNNGYSSTVSSTFLTRNADFIAAGCQFDAMIYSPFSPNDTSPTAAIIATQKSQLDTALAAISATGKPSIIWTPCVNTAANWTATADGYRLAFRSTLMGYTNASVVDIEAAVSDGATPARFKVTATTDGTHPNEVGHADMATIFRPAMQALVH